MQTRDTDDDRQVYTRCSRSLQAAVFQRNHITFGIQLLHSAASDTRVSNY